ncbi:MAG: hypothetical protein WA771_14630 [Chthoniobacterales bacterium]
MTAPTPTRATRNVPSKSKPVWTTPVIREIPIFFEVSLYAATR